MSGSEEVWTNMENVKPDGCSTMPDNEDTLDSLMAHLGEFGWYQCFQLFLHLLSAMVAGVHMMSMLTVAGIPEHRCRVPWLDNGTSITWDSEELLSAIPRKSDGTLSSCYLLDPGTNSSTPCNDWVYNNTYFTYTRTMQWDMVCDRRWMGALAQSSYLFGVFFGAITSGALSDKFGRKTVFCWSALFQLVVSTGIAFIDHYPLYLFGLIIYGIFGSAGAFFTAFVLTMELVGTSRKAFCILFHCFFIIGIMIVPAWASVIPDAKTLQLIYGAHSLLIFGHWWLMDESPRWLWGQGRIKESVNIVAKGARLNRGPKLDRTYYVSKGRSKADSGKLQSAQLTDLLKSPKLRARTLNIALNWFANSMTYYGLALSSNRMEGNPFTNIFIMALLDLPCHALIMFILDKVGCRSISSTLMLLGGSFLLSTTIVPTDMSLVKTIFVFIGKFCTAGAFGIVFIYTGELFPTAVRNTSIGFGSMCAKFGALIAPVISLLDALDKRAPIIIFSTLSLVSGFLTLFLPETVNQPIPQTFEDCETLGVGDTAFSCLSSKKNKRDRSETGLI